MIRANNVSETTIMFSKQSGTIFMIRTPETTKLSSTITVEAYRKLEQNKKQKEIAKFIKQRFTERYIAPMQGANKHGFSMMAVSCLTIEALESFWQGKKDTRRGVFWKCNFIKVGFRLKLFFCQARLKAPFLCFLQFPRDHLEIILF